MEGIQFRLMLENHYKLTTSIYYFLWVCTKNKSDMELIHPRTKRSLRVINLNLTVFNHQIAGKECITNLTINCLR